ncbi:hypothetical protein OG369_42855 [Streptomyces sp. NBC_01221]|uniref:hypothetical protein n=1 Tax=Streptomyces sp. NBC_01221 TaxID=2903782 RepID=UPI002259BAB2|nr:hypothetical protein [Streptomyces sp. NBC_01221]MCX4792519.1 hypothetical protein [Streptomyces sp. NBC_01221]
MNQRSRITGHTASTTTSDLDFNEALRRTAVVPAPRRLIAAGEGRGNGRLVIQAVSA